MNWQGNTTGMDRWEWDKKQEIHYPEVMGNHFLYQHSVDDHNNKRHSPVSLEVVWATNIGLTISFHSFWE